MRIVLRLAFCLLALAPLILLQGRPDLTPGWLTRDAAGVPAVIWMAILWYAMFAVAIWIPVGAGEGQGIDTAVKEDRT
jgi:hypothetical protein